MDIYSIGSWFESRRADMSMFKKRKTFSRENFTTDLDRRILEPEEVISGKEGTLYANRADDRSLTFSMLAFDIIERLKLTKDSRVLEVCCGSGQLASELSKYIKPENIVATDGSSELISAARDRYGEAGIKFEIENIHEMNRDNQFDCVICKDSFHHFVNPAQAIQELMRPLKSGGILYVFDLTREALDVDIDKRQNIIVKDHEAMRFLRSINASHTPKEFMKAAADAGESQIEVLYPFLYSAQNNHLHEGEIENDITGETAQTSLFAVYLIRKI